MDSDVREKLHKLTEDRRRIEDDLKEMRRERDDYRQKFEQANDELQKTKGTVRTSIRSVHDDSISHDARSVICWLLREVKHTPFVLDSRNSSLGKLNGFRSPRSSPTLVEQRPGSPLAARRLNSKEPTSPKRMSSANLRTSERTRYDRRFEISVSLSVSPSAHDLRVKGFREKRAAKVIQREWRRHNQSRRVPLMDMNKTRQENLDKVDRRQWFTVPKRIRLSFSGLSIVEQQNRFPYSTYTRALLLVTSTCLPLSRDSLRYPRLAPMLFAVGHRHRTHRMT